MSTLLYISRTNSYAIGDPNAVRVGCSGFADAFRELVRSEHREARFAMIGHRLTHRFRFYYRATPAGKWQRIRSDADKASAKGLSEVLTTAG